MERGLYRHYKGKYYWVQGIARDAETLEETVIYQGLYENEFGRNPLWTRRKTEFENPLEDGSLRYIYIGSYPEATEGIENLILPEL
ncbi:DUF1653 domain-containing protein [Candidatus Woesearchaeota archaeon]|nr:DUF1653 domain-containing protein [Candidatus Woesearchaeota archaeon]